MSQHEQPIEEEWQYEIRRRKEMDADDIAQEMAKDRDDEYEPLESPEEE